MTLSTLILTFAVIGIALTFLTKSWVKNRLVSFLQYFTGVWFVFSGVVKAIDPIGTSFKMQQYFGEFERTFEPTWLGFLKPLFPILAANSVGFALFIIIFEILLGLMLLVGSRPKLLAWLFLLLNVFFTILTGYTHLTGYVPEGVNFFELSKWGPWVKTNMKVTDCGCFGDFLKLEPTVSFYKDLFILTPISLVLLWMRRQFHSWGQVRSRNIGLGVAMAGTVFFCIYNTYLDEPVIDFRPFKNGVNIREQKKAESKALSEQKILNYKLKNLQTGQIIDISYDDYVTNKGYEKYPQDLWKVDGEPEKTPLAVPTTKISDFAISAMDGTDITDSILAIKDYYFMVVAWKLKHESPEYGAVFAEKINPFAAEAEKDGIKTMGLAYGDPTKFDAFRHATQAGYPIMRGDDDLVLKTMIRSNPGIFLMKDGQIIHKWHIKALPSYQEVKQKYIR